jgi:hypothetical protein
MPYFQVRTSVVAEHLVQEMQDVSSMRELTHSFLAATASSSSSPYAANGMTGQQGRI